PSKSRTWLNLRGCERKYSSRRRADPVRLASSLAPIRGLEARHEKQLILPRASRAGADDLRFLAGNGRDVVALLLRIFRAAAADVIGNASYGSCGRRRHRSLVLGLRASSTGRERAAGGGFARGECQRS